MEDITRKFTLLETRSKEGAIVDAIGNIGTWPFRRTISYNVGINCDAITVRDDRLHVLRRGRTVAIARLLGAPGPLPSIKWEDMLRPRRR